MCGTFFNGLFSFCCEVKHLLTSNVVSADSAGDHPDVTLHHHTLLPAGPASDVTAAALLSIQLELRKPTKPWLSSAP